METNKSKKTRKVVYVKELQAKRDELTMRLKDLSPGTDEFEDTRRAIEDINRILNERTNTRSTVLKVTGMLLLTVVGLGLAHKDDIGDSIPGKYVSSFVNTLLGIVIRK